MRKGITVSAAARTRTALRRTPGRRLLELPPRLDEGSAPRPFMRVAQRKAEENISIPRRMRCGYYSISRWFALSPRKALK